MVSNHDECLLQVSVFSRLGNQAQTVCSPFFMREMAACRDAPSIGRSRFWHLGMFLLSTLLPVFVFGDAPSMSCPTSETIWFKVILEGAQVPEIESWCSTLVSCSNEPLTTMNSSLEFAR